MNLLHYLLPSLASSKGIIVLLQKIDCFRHSYLLLQLNMCLNIIIVVFWQNVSSAGDHMSKSTLDEASQIEKDKQLIKR